MTERDALFLGFVFFSVVVVLAAAWLFGKWMDEEP